jgi:hypothetical protein
MFIMGTLLYSTTNKTDDNNYEFLYHNCLGPSAANFIARFCYGDEILTKKTREYLSAEESHDPDSIFAEIVHLPQARAGNIIKRPILRKYEIPYLSNSVVGEENQILVSDLYVRVRNNEVILRSARLGKRVIPRLTTAHNYGSPSSLPVYKFLCDMQYQNVISSYSWDWGKLAGLSYLPRVSYKKIILKRAQWRVELRNQTETGELRSEELKLYFSKLQKNTGIPRFVILSEGDNELFVDMENLNCLLILKSTLLKLRSILLVEFLSLPESCIVEGAGGMRYNDEIIVPLNKTLSNSKEKLQVNLELEPISNLKRLLAFKPSKIVGSY